MDKKQHKCTDGNKKINKSDELIVAALVNEGGFIPSRYRELLVIRGILEVNSEKLESTHLQQLAQLIQLKKEGIDLENIEKLPPSIPLRKFYSNVLCKDEFFVEIAVAKYTDGKGSDTELEEQMSNCDTNHTDHETIQKLREWKHPQLCDPRVRGNEPSSMAWRIKSNLVSPQSPYLQPERKKDFEVYRLLRDGNDIQAEKKMGSRSNAIPAMKAWLKRFGGCPPIIPAQFLLRFNQGTLRCGLESKIVESPLKQEIWNRIEDKLGKEHPYLRLRGRGEGEILKLDATFRKDAFRNSDEQVDKVISSWGEIYNYAFDLE